MAAIKSIKTKRWFEYSALASVIILIGRLVIPGSGPLHMGLKMETANQANQLVVACLSYRTEYGSWPETTENYRLVKILSGGNPRGIEFLSLKSSQLNSNGEDIDPWGTSFRITLMTESRVGVISAGPDKIFGTADDISNQ